MAERGGQPGNQNAKKGKLWADALRKELAGNQNEKRLRQIAKKLIDEAMEGNMQAIKEIGDRLDGKPAQSIDMAVKDITHEEALDMLDDE